MTTILVVDDEIDLEYLVKRRFRTKVQNQVYDFRFIHNGRDALTLLQNEPRIDLILLDINMPEMDGISLLRQLPVLNPLLQVVMVSAYGDMINIRTAMNLGAFDFIMKPIDFLDLEITIDKTIEHIHKLRESQQLKIIDELKTRFFDNITHEFRTPLTLVLLAAEQLRNEFPEPFRLQNGLLVIELNARQLLRLINQILDLAKLQSGQLNIKSLPGDLGAFIGEIVQAFETLANTRKLQLIYQNNLPGLYAFDPEKIEQIIYNLLTNALKFTENGTITVNLAACSSENGSGIRLSVTDTGLGILPEEIPYIFNRFYQVNNVSPVHKSGYQLNGTGIGLAIVKEIVGLMNGIVSVESNVDQPAGSRFTIDLTLPEVRDSQGTEHPQPIPSITTELSSTEPGFYPNVSKPVQEMVAEDAPLILVVDDSDELRKFLAGSLSNNYRILTASNSADAWELAKSGLPDIVVSDVMMPGQGHGPANGFQLTQQLKTDSSTDHIAVVLLTAKTSHQHLMEGLTKGADDYIAKPFHFDELELRLRNLLARRQKLQRHYQHQLTQPSNPALPETVQDQFLSRLYQLVDTHLDEPLPVEWVADELAMSRKTLYRKVQSLTQLSPNKLIRNYRLRRAADLLHAGHTVSETAYKVGFETSSHFARAFKELYNQTPTEFAGRGNN